MIVKKLQIKNIRSYEDVELDFPKGTVLLAGDIGSGKTSILLGLQFALFGLQPGQKGSSILRQGETAAYALLELQVQDQEIVLQRTIKKSSSGSITQDSNSICINGETEELSTSEMKERVMTLLNYPKEFAKRSNVLYKFTVYTPQEEMKAIITERPEVRLDTLRHIFGIDRYRRIKENATMFIQKIKDAVKVKEILTSELNLLKEKFSIETEKKIQLSRQKNNLEIEYGDIEKEQKESQLQLQQLQKSLEEKRKLDSEISKTTILLQSKKDLEARMKKEALLLQKQIQTPINFSEEQLRNTGELLEKHQKFLEEKTDMLLKLTSQISVLDSKKETQIGLKEKVTGLENCPTCFQVVGQEHKHKISKRTQFEIEDVNRELEEKVVRKEQTAKEVERQKDLIKGYQQDKNVLQENKIKYEHQKSLETKLKSDAFVIERITNEIKELEEKREALVQEQKTFEKSAEELSTKAKEYETITDQLRSKEILLATKNKELEILIVKLEELGDEIAEKEKIQDHLTTLRVLQDWLQEKFLPMITLTEKNVMMHLKSEFSSVFSQWFSILVSDSLTVRLDEDFTPIITNQDQEIDYDFLSGGERTAVALAYRLSLNQVLNSMLSQIQTKGIVILDEPTDGFSTEQIDKIRDILEELKIEQLIIVSHEQKIEGFVDHVIRIKKEHTSRIETE